MKSRKIGVAVGGRFSSLTLSNQLAQQGHAVHILSSLPKRKYGTSKASTQKHTLLPEVLFRLSRKMGLEATGDLLKMQLVAETSRKHFQKKEIDTLFAWSSFAEETFQNLRSVHKILVRESSHILFQANLLQKEYLKWNIPFKERKDILAREQREYTLADKILVPSHFAKMSFIKHQIPEEKMCVIPLGIDLEAWPFFEERPSSKPLRLLFVGHVSVRKGIPYLLEALKNFSKKEVALTLAGTMERGMEGLVKETPQANYIGPVKREKLHLLLKSHPIFILPSIEDGYGMALIEALAMGCVPITTFHVGAHEWLIQDVTGKICQPASAPSIHEAIGSFLTHPKKIQEMQQGVLELREGLSDQWYGERLSALLTSLT